MKQEAPCDASYFKAKKATASGPCPLQILIGLNRSFNYVGISQKYLQLHAQLKNLTAAGYQQVPRLGRMKRFLVSVALPLSAFSKS